MPGIGIKPERYPAESSPRIRLDFDTFEEWESEAEPYYQTQFGYLSRHQRSCYDMCGQTLFLEVIFEANIFKDDILRHVLVDFNITEDSDTMELVKKHDGFWEEAYYAEEGMGWPVFGGDDGSRRAWNFIQEWRAAAELG